MHLLLNVFFQYFELKKNIWQYIVGRNLICAKIVVWPFLQNYDLTKHLFTNNEENPHQGRYCDKVLSSNDELKNIHWYPRKKYKKI